MAIAGRLATISLAEILQILDRGQKTGMLAIQTAPQEMQENLHYIWFNRGRIVATAHRLDHMGLIGMLVQRQWVNANVAAQLSQLQLSQLCSLDMPLGSYLNQKGILQAEQLKLLFHAQVLQRICTLFKVKDADFKFDAMATLPKAEMTGLSISTAEATLMGLRVLKDWQPFAAQLPQPHVSLAKPVLATLTLQLDSLERQLWDLAHGTLSIQDMANRVARSLDLVQQAAFRLVAVGLVDEVPVDSTVAKISLVETISEKRIVEAPEQSPVTRSFLKNLLGFLRSKV